MSGVSALTTTTGNSMTGSISLTSTQTSLLNVSNNPSAPFNINFSPVFGGVNSVGGKNGNVLLTTPDGCLSITPDAISPQLKFNAYNAGSNTSGMVANNVSGSLAWVASNAFAVGAVVNNSGSTYMCLSAQPASSPAPSAGSNWAVIGGGGGGGSSITAGGATVACDDPSGSGSITLTTTATGTDGSVIIDASAGASGNVVINASDGYVGISGDIALVSPNTQITMDDNGLGTIFPAGTAGVISLATTDSNASQVNIGGASNATGLWVGASNLTFNGSNVSGGAGGNWSYKGTWASSNAYSLNDVVFNATSMAGDANKIGYIALSNIPASSNAPWTVAGQSNGWQPYFNYANNGIVGFNNGSNASDPSYTTQLTMSAVSGAPPPVNPSSNGDYIMTILNNDGGGGDKYGDFNAGRFVVAGINSGLNPTGSNTLPFLTTTGDTSNIQLSVNGGGAQPVNIVGGLTVDGNPVGSGGNMTYNSSNFVWAGSNSYNIGDIVSDTNNGVYVATLANSNAQPQSNVADWQLVGSTSLTSGSGITGIEINGGTAYPTSGSIINFQPGNGIVMSNTGSNIINISASPQGSGAYLTNNANTWEWLSTNSYSATEGVVSYQGGLYANILAPSSNVAPFGASNSTTLWAGLAPSLSIGTSNITPLQASASNAYTYSLITGAGSALAYTSPSTGVIQLDLAETGITIPGGSNILPVSNVFTFQSSASNIAITSPGAGLIDFNVDAPAMNYSGIWTATGTYQVDDVVLYGEASWVCLVATTAGQSPDTTPASWRILGTIPTNLASVLPADMVSGVVPNECLVANVGYDSWGTSNAYRKGNVISMPSGSLYSALTNNTGSIPTANPGSNSDWVKTGFITVASTLQLQTGSNVATPTYSSSNLFPYSILTASSPLGQNGLTFPTNGGCYATFTGSGTWGIGTGGLSNAGSVIGVQLFDTTGGSNTSISFSSPSYFPTPIPYTQSSSQTYSFPSISCSITTINSGAPPTAYSVALLSDTVSSGTIVPGTITGSIAYVFSGTGSNNTFT